MRFLPRTLPNRPPTRLAAWTALVALLAGALLPAAPAAPNNGLTGPRSGVWAHEISALKPDPAVTWGRLDNGLRYALLPHQGVPGRVSFRLIVLTGSLDETDRERGIAHFIEHMAFRSTRHFTSEQLVEFFQQLGMDPNSDINARTGTSETVYMLELRENQTALVEQALIWLRDVADGVSFKPEELDQERGVILSEIRVRDGLLARNMAASSPVLFKGLRFAERSPGGTPERIRGMQREDFLGFYQRNYRSDQMIMVVAGDFAAPELAGMIRTRFADMVKPNKPLPSRDEGRLDVSKNLRAGVFKITDVGSASALVGYAAALAPKPDSRETRLDALRREFALDVFSTRVAKELGGGAGYIRTIGYEASMASAEIDSEEWARGLGVIDDLVRFTSQNGFEQREVDMVKRRYTTQTQFMLEQKDSLDPAVLAEAITESVTNHLVYLGFAQEQELRRDWLAQLNLREIHTAFQASWDFERMAFHVGGDVEIEGGAAEIIKKVQQDRKGGLRHFRPEARKETVFTLPTWDTPTEVVESREVTEIGATLMRFGNNVRLNFVPNRGDPGIVRILVRFGTGLIDMPENRPALKEFGLQTLISGGSPHFTTESLAKIIEDHLYSLGFDLDENDAFAFRAIVAPDKIEVPLAIMTDFLYRPTFGSITHREEKFKAVIMSLLGGGGMDDGERQLQNHLFRGDPRFTWVTDPKEFLGLSTIDVRNWLQPPLTRGYLEVSIVGDISAEAAISAVSKTLGSLPERVAEKKLTATPKPVKIAARPGYARIEFVGEQHIAQVAGIWPIHEPITIRDNAALLVLAKVLEQHIYREIRSKLGLAYSPDAALQRFSGIRDFGMMRARIACDPDDANRVATLLEELGAEIANGGITAAEFTGARGVLSGQIKHGMNDGSFLLGMVRRAQENPESLENAIRLRHGLIDEITLDEVNAWAARVLPRKNSRTAAIVPKQFIGIFQTGQ